MMSPNKLKDKHEKNITDLFIAVTAIWANPMTGTEKHAVKHENKSTVKDKTSIKDKSKNNVLDLDKKQNKMERKAKKKAIKAVI